MVRIVAIALLSTLFFGTTAFAADAVDGTWKLNIAKSKFSGTAPKSTTRVYTESADGTALGLGFFAYDPGFHGGVNVAIGTVAGAPGVSIITGAGPGGGDAHAGGQRGEVKRRLCQAQQAAGRFAGGDCSDTGQFHRQDGVGAVAEDHRGDVQLLAGVRP